MICGHLLCVRTWSGKLRAVHEFTSDPPEALRGEAKAFVAAACHLEEIIPPQFGPIPVGLQSGFCLNELVLRPDVAQAAGGA